MRVLYLSPDYPPNARTGIATYVQSMARAVVAAGHEAHVLTSEVHGGPPDDEDHGVRVHRRPVLHIPGIRRAMSMLPTAWAQDHLPQQAMTRPGRRLGLGFTSLLEATRLKREFDVVETPDYFSPGWTIALRGRWPVLTVLHTPLQVEAQYSRLPDRAYLRASCWIERRGASLSSAISAPSQLVKQELLQLGWTTVGRATVDPIGIDVDEYPYDPRGARPDRVLIVGHVNPRKGHDILARAAARLLKSGRKLDVVSVGSSGNSLTGSSYRHLLEVEIEQSGVSWTFVEHVDRRALREWYASASVVVVPSRFESFSLAAVEAMLSGRPAIVSDRCGIVESCPQGVEHGLWVFPAENDELLARSIEDALVATARSSDAGRAARETALRSADVRATLSERLHLYSRVAAG